MQNLSLNPEIEADMQSSVCPIHCLPLHPIRDKPEIGLVLCPIVPTRYLGKWTALTSPNSKAPGFWTASFLSSTRFLPNRNELISSRSAGIAEEIAQTNQLTLYKVFEILKASLLPCLLRKIGICSEERIGDVEISPITSYLVWSGGKCHSFGKLTVLWAHKSPPPPPQINLTRFLVGCK